MAFKVMQLEKYIKDISGIVQSAYRIAMGRTVRESNPGGWGGGRISASVQTGPGAHPVSCTMGTGSLSCGKAAGAWR
jgi:hypothetical protein